jgi:hypothetical protein
LRSHAFREKLSESSYRFFSIMIGYNSDEENSESLTDEFMERHEESIDVNTATSAVWRRHRNLMNLRVSGYIGGINSHYKRSFEKALESRLKEKTTIFQQFETNLITKADVRKKAINSPEELIAELKRDSKFIFIISHIHQGNDWWDFRTIPLALKELEDHPFCFPAGIKIGCPVWQQDKWWYLFFLANEKKLQSVSK